MLMISIPCAFENNILKVNGLGFKAEGDSPEQALLVCIKNTPYYNPLILATFTKFKNHRGREFMHLETIYDESIIKLINEVEPYPPEKPNKLKQKIETSTAQEVIDYAYPE